MSVNRLSANFKARNDLQDQITPNVEYSSDYKVIPAGEFVPAPWLPIVWKDEASKDAFVISKGKVVALTTEGHVVPAGLRTKLQSGLSYTADDVTHGVINLTTGSKVTAAVSYTGLQVAQALVARGLVLEDNFSGAPAAATTIPAFISKAVGICAQDVYVWAGDDLASTHFVNYQKQHMITFMSQCQLVLPNMVPAAVTTSGLNATTLTTTVFNAATQPMVDAGQLWNATNIALLARYSGLVTAASSVVAIGLDHQPVARITDRTPLTCDVTSVSVLVRERTGPDLISQAGDFFLDADVGVLFLHSDTWAALVTAGETDVDFTYYAYTAAGTSADAASEKFALFCTEAKPGDWVGYDSDSNLIAIEPTTALTVDEVGDVLGLAIGRVTGVIVEPRGLLDKVKTAWNYSGVDSKVQMAGSATKGFSDRITLMDEVVADKLVIAFIDCK